MRNLKKILALVLALIMSLSLMATAGATDFSDADQITDDYAESVDVLNGLKVFQGYPSGDFQPQGEIKRSEVAVIIYRIATGDVDDSQVSIYKDYNKFSDVTSSHWAAGYINYCANAEYIKGRNAKTFDPEGKVTGYEALAMILRAVGYDKQGEFTGSNWHIQTAATGKQLGVTDKINSDIMLKQPATREMVAEILCKSILVPTVEYTAAFGYRDYTGSNTADKNESLGYKTFKLERLEGVVTGNEYADLETEGSAMKDDITRLVVGDRKLNLQVESYFGDIGESRYAYVVPTDKSEHTLVTSKLYDTGKNDNPDTGNASTLSALAGSLRTNDDTQYFINYDRTNIEWKSEWRVSYYISAADATANGWVDFLEGWAVGTTKRADRVTDAAGNVIGYYRWIAPGDAILATDQVIIQDIFYSADLRGTAPLPSTTAKQIVEGEVYVGTASEDDISDVISYNQFLTTYILTDLVNITGNENGNYLKVIDNDNDGNVEYVLKTVFYMDEVAAINGDSIFYRNIGNGADVRYEDSEYKYDGYYKYNADPALTTGTVVVAAPIEGVWYAQITSPKAATIQTVVYATPSVTTTEGDEYKQSGITNWTTMADRLQDMSERVEYSLYVDLFGHLRAYDAPRDRYGLLTEMYPTTEYNGTYVRNIPWIAEMMTSADTYPIEYNVNNAYPNGAENVFIDNGTPITGLGVINTTVGRYNYLQNAVAHLGLNNTSDAGDVYNSIGHDASEFEWNSNAGIRQSETNVAKFTKGENGVYLYSASEYATKNGAQLYYGWLDNDNNGVITVGDVMYNRDGTTTAITAANIVANGLYKGVKLTASEWNTYFQRYGAPASVNLLQPVYAEDYIQLAIENITAGMRQYTMSDYDGRKSATDNAQIRSTEYVEAVNDTEFYIVGANNSIRHYTGYATVPGYAAEDIKAAYAVAQNYNINNDAADYWVADVIVIELEEAIAFDSISLAYGNPSQTTNEIKRVDALNNETEGNKQVLYPNTYDWGGQMTGSAFGFWGLTNTTDFQDGKSANVTRIREGNYNKNGIYAGTVVNVNGSYGRGGYLAVDTDSDGIANRNRDVFTSYANVAVPVYAISNNGGLTQLTIVDSSVNSQVRAGDGIIWVYNAAGQIDFIVDIGYVGRTGGTEATWLQTIFVEIIREQQGAASSLTATFRGYADGQTVEDVDGSVIAIDRNHTAGDKTIRLNYSDALAGTNGNIVLTALGTDQAFQLQSVSAEWTKWNAGTELNILNAVWNKIETRDMVDVARRNVTIPADADNNMAYENSDTNYIWRVTVTTTTNGVNNATETYYFIREASMHNAGLTTTDVAAGLPNAPVLNGNAITFNDPAGDRSTETFIKCFKPTQKGSILWILTDAAGHNYTVNVDRYGNVSEADLAELRSKTTGTMKDFTSVVALVRDENGLFNSVAQTYPVNPAAAAIIVVPNPAEQDQIDVPKMIITPDANGGLHIEVLIEGNGTPVAYEQNSFARAAGLVITFTKGATVGNVTTWTADISAADAPSYAGKVFVVVVNSEPVTPVDPTVKHPSEVDVTIDGTPAAEGTDYTYDAATGTLTIDTTKLPEGKEIASVKIGDTVVTPDADGKYILNTETTDKATVTVTLKEEGTEPTVTVNFVDAEGTAVEGGTYSVAEGKLTVTAPSGYTVEKAVMGDKELTAVDGKYDLGTLTEDVTVTVTVKKTETPTPVEPTDTIQAKVTGSNIEFYAYKGETIDDAKAIAAIKAALELEDDDTVVIEGGIATVTEADGTVTNYALKSTGDGSMAKPKALYLVTYNGNPMQYVQTGTTSLKGFNKGYIIVKGTTDYKGFASGSAVDSDAAVADADTAVTLKAAVTADIEYVDATKVTLTKWASAAASDSEIEYITINGEKTNNAQAAGPVVYVEKGVAISVTGAPKPTRDKEETIVVLAGNGKVAGEGKGDGYNITVEIADVSAAATDGAVTLSIGNTYKVIIDGVEKGIFAAGAEVDLTGLNVTSANKLVKKGAIADKTGVTINPKSATQNYFSYTVAGADADATSGDIELYTSSVVTVGYDETSAEVQLGTNPVQTVNFSGSSTAEAWNVARGAVITLAEGSVYLVKETGNASDKGEQIDATAADKTYTVGEKNVTITKLTGVSSINVRFNDAWAKNSGISDEGAVSTGGGSSKDLALADDIGWAWTTTTSVAIKVTPPDNVSTIVAETKYIVEISGIVLKDTHAFTFEANSSGVTGAITVDSSAGTIVGLGSIVKEADGTYTITVTIETPDSSTTGWT